MVGGGMTMICKDIEVIPSNGGLYRTMKTNWIFLAAGLSIVCGTALSAPTSVSPTPARLSLVDIELPRCIHGALSEFWSSPLPQDTRGRHARLASRETARIMETRDGKPEKLFQIVYRAAGNILSETPGAPRRIEAPHSESDLKENIAWLQALEHEIQFVRAKMQEETNAQNAAMSACVREHDARFRKMQEERATKK